MSENSGKKKAAPKVETKVIKAQFSAFEDPVRPIKKSEKTEQLDDSASISASDWIPKPVDMVGLDNMVRHSTILPQCIRAYKNNIAGFGLKICYVEDIEETEESKAEWDQLKRIIDLFSLEMDTKEVFEKIVEDREKYGIAYVECIRNMSGELVQVDFIENTPSIEMTYPLEPYVDIEYSYHGEIISRKKKFRKFRQTVGGKTVYFKEFGDPRIMDKRDGTYLGDGKTLEIDNQANEILDFNVGNGYYGTVRWIGQILTVDGNHKSERLNNNYFRNGRHTPLMIVVRGGTLSDESFTKLQEYIDGIKGESGQHAFMVLEAETTETTTAFTDVKQPDIEIKDMASILQKDELFQEYQQNGRKKVQSAFLLPDLYVGYTTDFNRATAHAAMEITEKQVFQPERTSLAWIINHKLLNEYGFKYVECKFDTPDITNPEDIMKILSVTERAGGLTMNDARALTRSTLGQESEDYPKKFDMDDIGTVPLAVINAITAMKEYGYDKKHDESENSSEKKAGVDPAEVEQLDQKIQKAMDNKDTEVAAVMKEVRRLLVRMDGVA